MTPHTDLVRTDIENQLHGCVSLLIRISQLFCSAPLRVQLRPLPSPGASRSRFVRIANRLLSLAYLGILLLCIYFQKTITDSARESIENFLYTCSYAQIVVNMAIILVGAQRLGSQYPRTFQRIVRIDIQLLELMDEDAAALQYSHMRRNLRIQMLLFGLLMCSCTTVDFFYSQQDWLAFWRSLLVYIVPNFTIGTCLMQYTFGLRVLRARFAMINRTMERLLTGEEKRGKVGQVILVKAVRWEKSAVQIEQTLNRLRELHFQLNQLNSSLTANFGAMLIGNFVAVCVVLTIALFTFYLIASNENHRLGWPQLLYTDLWLLLHVWRVSTVLWHSEKVNRERRAVLCPLYRLECGGGQRLQVAGEQAINKFSVQILHDCQYQTACGILQLNLSVLATIVGSLTSYLVILIQFDSSTRYVHSANGTEQLVYDFQ